MVQSEHKLRTSKIFLCCGMAMMGIGLLALGAASGIFFTQDSTDLSAVDSSRTDVERLLAQVRNSSDADIQKMVLNADSAARGKAMSMATGQISNDVEGLYVLDHTTGSLSCLVLSPRNGGDGISLFSTNVNEHLGATKAGQSDYVLTTGAINANVGGRAGNQRPANCVCYVADSSTGNVAMYSFQYNRTALDNGQGQNGALTLVWQGASREAIAVRD